MALETTRRRLITGLISFVAAPAIVRAQNLMPVKVMKPEEVVIYEIYEGNRIYWLGPDGAILMSQERDILPFVHVGRVEVTTESCE